MLTTTWGPIAAALMLGAVGGAVLACQGGRLAGTTLIAARRWAMGALAVVVATELVVALLAGDRSPAWVASLRYAAATATLCPLVALLGARRPRHRPWQMIVLSLWVILQVPNVQWSIVGSGEPLRVFPAWSWFLAVLIVVSLFNHLPTRLAPAALLAAVGQAVLLAAHLPLVERLSSDSSSGAAGPLVGTGFLVAAALWVACQRDRRTTAARPLDRLWLDFRDLYGAVWALRVAARVNASAATNDWSITLLWSGFCPSGPGRKTSDDDHVPAPEITQPVERSLRSLLRHFVSPEWISERLERT